MLPVAEIIQFSKPKESCSTQAALPDALAWRTLSMNREFVLIAEQLDYLLEKLGQINRALSRVGSITSASKGALPSKLQGVDVLIESARKKLRVDWPALKSKR
jgi:hypothetical protein